MFERLVYRILCISVEIRIREKEIRSMELNVLNVAKVIMSLVGKKKSITHARLSNIIFLLWSECRMHNFDFEATFYGDGLFDVECEELYEYNNNEFLCYNDFKSIQLTEDDRLFKETYRNTIKKRLLSDNKHVFSIGLYDAYMSGDVVEKKTARRFALYCMIFPELNSFSDTSCIDVYEMYEIYEEKYNVLLHCINLSTDALFYILNSYVLGYYSDALTIAERVVACSSELSKLNLYNDDRRYLLSSALIDNGETVYLQVTDEDVERAGRIIPKYDVLKEIIDDDRVLFYALKN